MPGHLPPVDPRERDRLLGGLLKGVSRAFYLTLRVLPKALRAPIGLAYLLARAADTIADTRLIAPAQRMELLLSFRAQVQGPAALEPLAAIARALNEQQDDAHERALLESLPPAFALLESFEAADAARVREVVVTLSEGMEFDLRTFPAEDSGKLEALASQADLDRYTYYVAGCVGPFWTRMLAAHVPAVKHWDVEALCQTGIRFGKALQYTNVLRDVPRDLRIGRCYLPRQQLAAHGLAPEELLDPAAAGKARPVLAGELKVALEHYEHAERYILAIPARCVRLRLAVLWPVLIGLATLEQLARHSEQWLDPQTKLKVSRGWVYRMMAGSFPSACSDAWVRGKIGRLRTMVERALGG